jgi:hypothetical protein
MSFFESHDQQAGFVREFFSAREVALFQRCLGLIQEGLGLSERLPFGIGKLTALNLLDARAHLVLYVLKLLPPGFPRVVCGLERRRFDQRLGRGVCRRG